MKRLSEAVSANKYWLWANAIGIVIFLFLSALFWPPQNYSAQNIKLYPPGTSGIEGLLVAITMLPVLGFFAILDASWAGALLCHYRHKARTAVSVLFLCLIAAAWAAIVIYDTTHTYRSILID